MTSKAVCWRGAMQVVYPLGDCLRVAAAAVPHATREAATPLWPNSAFVAIRQISAWSGPVRSGLRDCPRARPDTAMPPCSKRPVYFEVHAALMLCALSYVGFKIGRPLLHSARTLPVRDAPCGHARHTAPSSRPFRTTESRPVRAEQSTAEPSRASALSRSSVCLHALYDAKAEPGIELSARSRGTAVHCG